ncbi:YaeF family permuted papain-like enzyme [Dryocola sp. BD626]|uniref:YaeF family permuted papain-like enzyme n=1 Tax=Dryocola sp. BD626 TaxID=3133273 RepID=UPI003F509496
MPQPSPFALRVTLLAALLSGGCTMDVSLSKPQETSVLPVGIQLRQPGSAPRNILIDITQADLRAGDLLLSSSISLTSVGIRVFSTSAVSHVALYIGEGEVAEAVGGGVQIVTIDEAMKHSDKILALRMTDLTQEEAQKVRQFAQQKAGSGYNYKGIIEMAPFMVTKQLCSLNPFSKEFRQQCVRGLAAAQLSTPTGSESRYFCSQFVIAAYEQAGHPLTVASASWVSPGDLLHMREGDVATLAANQPLLYVGHLKPGIYYKARELVNMN